jgi:hypothetical protein
VTLAEFSIVVDAPPKWVLNTRAILGLDSDYTVEAAEHLALVRALNRDFGIALPRASDLAVRALRSVTVAAVPSGFANLVIDVVRLRMAIATRLSLLSTQHAPRRAGRKPRRTAPLSAAKRHGLDVTLLRANLALSPADRLRQLDAMASFRTRVRRVT